VRIRPPNSLPASATRKDFPERGVVAESEDLFPVGPQRFLVRDHAATHRLSKNRVTRDRNRTRESGDDIGRAPGRMTTSQACLDAQLANLKSGTS